MYAFGAGASAAQVSVAWDPSPDSDAAGYTVHWGNGSGNYTASQDVGASLQHTVVGLNEGKTYYFAVTAYDGTVDAGVGETVLIVSGSSARMASGLKDCPVDAAIVGIIDQIEMTG
jgi:microcompartment protein CcmK/EutM